MVDDARKILLVAYGGGHVAMLASVWERLTEIGHNVVFLALTTAQDYLNERGIPHIGFRDLQGSADTEVQGYGKKLLGGLSQGKVNEEESIAYLGLSYRDLVAQHGESTAEKLYAECGRQVFLPVNTLKTALKTIKPDVVVATNSPRAERAAILAAGELGVPSVCVVDLYPSKELEWLKINGYAQKVCVLNSSVKDILVAHGRNSDDVVITGNPAFDRHYSFDRYQEAARIKLDFFNKKIVVGFASNALPIIPGANRVTSDQALPREVFEKLYKRCLEKNYVLALRQHPSEVEWPEIGDAINCKSMPIDLYLACLDMLVTFPSTIALEAKIHHLRTSVVNFSCLSQTSPYLFQGDFEVLNCIEDIDNLTVLPREAMTTASSGKTSAARNISEVVMSVL